MAVISNNADLNNIIHAMDYPWIYKYRRVFNNVKIQESLKMLYTHDISELTNLRWVSEI